MDNDKQKKRRTSKWTLAAITKLIPSYRSRVAIVVIGMVLGAVSLIYTSSLARQLREKENYEVQLWATAIALTGQYGGVNNPLMNRILDNRSNIPIVMLDENFSIPARRYNNIPESVMNHPDKLDKLINKMYNQGNTFEITALNGSKYYIFYGNSKLQRTLAIFPFVQIGVIIIFIVFGFITFSTSKEDEQNKVWIGLAKETAHQLGTPISSLLGWLEYLRSQVIDPNVVGEMVKDLTRLMQVADSF